MNGASIPLAGVSRAMNTLVLRQVPDGLYRRLKAVAAAHRCSMNQEAILALAGAAGVEPAGAGSAQRRGDPGVWR